MGARKSEEGLMPTRKEETFSERLEYCCILLRVHHLITEDESMRIKTMVANGKCERGQKEVME